MGGVGSGVGSGGGSGGGRWQGGIANSVSGDGDDGLAVEKPDILNGGGVRFLDFEEHAGAV